MNNLIEFDYEGRIIPFVFYGNDYMINATEMVKLFPKKRINDFLSSNQSNKRITKSIKL